MDSKRSHDDEEDNTEDEPYRPKRRKTLSEPQYTVAWICALHIEMSAAVAMLDEVHGDLPLPKHDSNAYVLGRIQQHNIVIACLPAMQYGTLKAGAVLTHLIRTFTSIRIGLMVGIGGGVPSIGADIRLGDIVVGTRVMPYDLSKVLADGVIERTDVVKTLQPLAGTVVSSLRARHDLEGSRVQSILEEKTKNYPEYRRPDLPDRLFQATYDHPDASVLTCIKCDSSKVIPRRIRISNQPEIHYGAVGSGNQVIKHGTTRDQYSRSLNGIVCFEMEAAGLMDLLPCIPIRGICDYSDSHKSKEWQRYAAMAAAAYAKEIVEVLPADETLSKSAGNEKAAKPSLKSSDVNVLQERRQRLLQSLKFDHIDSRKTSIKREHAKTCRWILQLPEYAQWLDEEEVPNHHGFLWIKGKPAVGKSTIMKFLYGQWKKKDKVGDVLTISFFFNARGDYLERSITGMYRSLLFQLLEAFPGLQDIFDDSDIIPRTQEDCPPLDILKSLFHSGILRLGERSVSCFIDALDECDEQQAADIVCFFEELSEMSTDNGIRLKVCFSSRHYPYIDIRVGLLLVLENQDGHTDDLTKYIQGNLRIKDSTLLTELQSDLLKKSAGVFLWVVLVVEILNKESRRGGYALRKRLSDVPVGLTELFKDLLKRDQENMEDLLLCVLWILFAKRPLEPKEYYHAIWTGLAMRNPESVDKLAPDTNAEDAEDNMEIAVISSSKGLAEITKAKKPVVQFIHESVRDFLIKDGGLYELWPDLGMDWEGTSHDTLKSCCQFYLRYRASTRYYPKKNYPFLYYAAQNLLYHADAAATVHSQEEFLSQFNLAQWIRMYNGTEASKSRHYTPKASLTYILADRGLARLIRPWLKTHPSIDIVGELYQLPLFAALASGSKDAACALLGWSSPVINGCDITAGFRGRTDFTTRGYKRRSLLTWAAEQGLLGFVVWLLDQGANPNQEDRAKHTALWRAFDKGHMEVVKLLIERGASVRDYSATMKAKLLGCAAGGGHVHLAEFLTREESDVDLDISVTAGNTPLTLAILKGHFQVARVFIRQRADPNMASNEGQTPLSVAIKQGHFDIATNLVSHDAILNLANGHGETPLTLSIRRRSYPIVKLLLEHGASVKRTNAKGRTPLSVAFSNQLYGISKLLIEYGAELNQMSFSGTTLLNSALSHGSASIARLFIDHHADVNLADITGKTPLMYAVQSGFEDIVEILLQRHGNVNATNHAGKTALMYACEGAEGRITKLLLDNGADVHAETSARMTALKFAAKKGYYQIVKLLLENMAVTDNQILNAATVLSGTASLGFPSSTRTIRVSDRTGADVYLPLKSYSAFAFEHELWPWLDIRPETLLRQFLQLGCDPSIRDKRESTPLISYAIRGSALLANLFLDHGGDVNAKNENGHTALMRACVSNNLAYAAVLIERGADINAVDERGRSALGLAISQRHTDVINLLFQKETSATPYGLSPLLPAAMQGSVDAVRILLNRGADVNSVDGDGYTPLMHAANRGHLDVTRLLIERGANFNAILRTGDSAIVLAARNGHDQIERLLATMGANLDLYLEEFTVPAEPFSLNT